MDVEVNVRGLAALEARLQEIGGLASQKIVRRVLRKIAKPMLASAKANAGAVARSGALSRSIGIINKRPKGRQVAAIAVTSRAKDRTALYVHNTAYNRRRKGIFYGWMVDRGTVKTRPRPWFTPAVNANESRAVTEFAAELQRAIDRITRRKSPTPSPDTVVPE